MIFIRHGKEYLKVNNKNWNNYLNIVSPHRRLERDVQNRCALKDKDLLWCDNCNSGIGSWKNSCVNVISSLNYVKYEDVLKNDDNNNESEKSVEIELDRNDDKGTI